MKWLLYLILLPATLSAQAPTCDILIRNGKIIDGTGNSWFYADIAVKDGRITRIAKSLDITATKTIDAKGMIVAPGFIDVHTHLEGDEKRTLQLPVLSLMESLLALPATADRQTLTLENTLPG